MLKNMGKTFLFTTFVLAVVLSACNQKEDSGRFTLTGDVKNIDDQKVYLEQLFFSQQPPQVLDTGTLKDGHFKVSAIAAEDGMYRIRFEKVNSGYIFINDEPEIKMAGDINDETLTGATFRSPANNSLMKMLVHIDEERNRLVSLSGEIDTLKQKSGSDSLLALKTNHLSDVTKNLNDYIIKYIDTTTQPIIALFALGYTQGIDPAVLKTVVPGLAKRFPGHQGISGVVAQYNEMMASQGKAQASAPGQAAVGSMAPDFTMTDTDGKPFTLSQLRGKYVLVDFWASWCAPCRGENPNVVAAYNKYKDKNFTILGVSLDDDKQKWLQAIQSDHLTWKHVSDLKGWQNAAVDLYGFDGIPYNVLLDPQGKIIATTLRENDLQAKLAEVLN